MSENILIYVASSWTKTPNHNEVIMALRRAKYDVYNYREQNVNFNWSDICPNYRENLKEWRHQAFTNNVAYQAYRRDAVALVESDVVIMLLPCGKSAHMELAYGIGAGKLTIILFDDKSKPELMYRMADHICYNMDAVFDCLESREVPEI